MSAALRPFAMISVEGVSRWYGPHAAVRELDFAIAEGELVGLLGLNGAGKTTTLRLLAGLLRPTTGTVRLDGLDADAPLARARIGFLPDRPPLADELRVRAYLRYAGELRGRRGAALEEGVAKVLGSCGLEAVADEPIATLSHGYRQRVGIAQALVHAPRLLLLDEPIQGLDPMQIVEMRELVRSLRGAHTVILSTHILGEIARTCDRVLLLHEGRLAAEGTQAELRAGAGGEGRALVARVRGEAAAARAAAEAVPGVEAVELEEEDGALRLEVRGERDLREALAAGLVGAGLGLLALGPLRSELEAVFHGLRGGDA